MAQTTPYPSLGEGVNIQITVSRKRTKFSLQKVGGEDHNDYLSHHKLLAVANIYSLREHRGHRGGRGHREAAA